MADGRYVMVSEWMVNGNINEFAEAHPDADRLGLVSFLFRVLSSQFSLMSMTAQLP